MPLKPNVRTILVHLQPILLGVAAFFVIVGPRALRPWNIAWLSSDDPSTHYLAWAIFRHAPWSFPLGLNPNYGLELSSSVVFSDSIPLLAIFFKTFNSILPETFQYFGIWILASFVLQAFFAWKILSLFSSNYLVLLLGTGLFVFAPPMLWRLHGHWALLGHYAILAGLYLSLAPSEVRRWLWWPLLIITTALVHLYLLAMVLALWMADLLRRFAVSRRRSARFAIELLVVCAGAFLALWQAGAFALPPGSWPLGEYGFYRMNLLSPIDAGGWSYILSDLPQHGGDYEGFSFLGLGAIMVVLFALPAMLEERAKLYRGMLKYWPLIAVLAGLTIFALSDQISVGSGEFTLPFSLVPEKLGNIFRSSGRFFWPVFYAILIVVLATLLRRYTVGVAGALLLVALCVQIVDTSAAWTRFRGPFMAPVASDWESPLQSEFWERAARRYQKVRLVPPQNHAQHWQVFAAFAARHRMATDSIYLARIDSRKLGIAHDDAVARLQDGRFDHETLYVLLDEHVEGLARRTHVESRDFVGDVDGFVVLAPGWNSAPER